MWAVVKADGYGHGAPAIAGQALRSGAAGLCVALAQEGIDLRRAGIEAPILVLSEQPPDQLAEMLAAGLTPTVYSTAYIDALAAAIASGAAASCHVHLKVDTGMQRVGAQPVGRGGAARPRSRARTARVHGRRLHAPRLRRRSRRTVQRGAAGGVRGGCSLSSMTVGCARRCTHAANSAAALAHPASRFDMVRAGIAIYGISPGPGVDHLARDLRPVMSLRARVSLVKRVAGRHARLVRMAAPLRTRHHTLRPFRSDTPTVCRAGSAPCPTGPAADVLIGGRRCPIVGVVTMDQLMVDVGEADVAVGDEVVLIGRQGERRDPRRGLGRALGTIGYEIVCGISSRVPRVLRSCSIP